MAAKKRTKKGPREAKPARKSVKPPDPSGESAAPAADPASAESKPERSGPPVVGVGASAGGLDAFKRFFGAMPADSGIAFVLVPHLDPAHESLMVELLARHTAMPVVEAENDMPVEANHVYIIPPNKYITIHGGTLSLTGPVERRTSQTTIDHFLRSLADDQQERAICIILSGTGAHGTLGLKAVKAAGGMAMVQDPATAEYERMPQSAIATGLADYVLPAERMPEALIKYVQHAYVNGGTEIAAAPEAGDSLTQVLALLRARTGFDFRPYRKKMLTRRVERRMGLNHLDSIPDYMTFLRDHQEEAEQLVKDLFISVTSFFRDPEAFEALASQVIGPLVRRKEPDGVIRVWVPGCATGEEAYSLVILLLEQLAAAKRNCALQVFATDVDQDALDVARQGLYPESIAGDVTPERLARHFTRVDESSYQVSKQVREAVTFASQNLIADAPFSKLDLISCRNLLIYLGPDVQQKVVALLHFALLAAAQRALSSLELQPGLCKEGTGQVRLLPQAPDGEVEFLVQLVQVPAHHVAHLDILQVMPAPFVPRVEVGGVARQGLQPHPAPRAGHELLDLRPPMDRRAVPDHQQPLPRQAEQVQEELDAVQPVE
jgi:two-component system CheB/CheR fusion protein